MPEEERTFEFSTSIDQQTAADYLEGLARQLRSGSAQLASAESAINLAFGGPIKFELEAESRRGRGSIEIELTWREPEPAAAVTMTIQDASEEELAAEAAPASMTADEI
jgi:amphi-Trp domain-containing protein